MTFRIVFSHTIEEIEHERRKIAAARCQFASLLVSERRFENTYRTTVTSFPNPLDLIVIFGEKFNTVRHLNDTQSFRIDRHFVYLNREKAVHEILRQYFIFLHFHKKKEGIRNVKWNSYLLYPIRVLHNLEQAGSSHSSG